VSEHLYTNAYWYGGYWRPRVGGVRAG